MHMGVRHCLACGRPVVHADVECVWFELLLQLLTHCCHCVPDALKFIGVKIEDAGHMPLRDDERVAFGNWKLITKCPDVLGDHDALIVTELAEGAGSRVHRDFLRKMLSRWKSR